jgi:hypothetical protein
MVIAGWGTASHPIRAKVADASFPLRRKTASAVANSARVDALFR